MNQEIAMQNKNTYFSMEVYNEYTSDMADKVMKLKLGDNYENYIQEDSEGNISYTEEGQDMFIEILDDFCHFIAKFGMYSEADRDA
jgi:hypothetical protein